QGKTTLANNIAISVAKKNKHVAVFNLEMSKEQIFEKILTMTNICAKIKTNVVRKFSRKGGIIGQLHIFGIWIV
ncbi:MAG: replicative DNA helicase, partial [Peptococcaceae bacterium]|nr:replicative DNA helicase [Peptococcaceae bacterium]